MKITSFLFHTVVETQSFLDILIVRKSSLVQIALPV
jgi:hypothetical protein